MPAVAKNVCPDCYNPETVYDPHIYDATNDRYRPGRVCKRCFWISFGDE